MNLPTPEDRHQAVTLAPSTVADLRGYLARAHDWNAEADTRSDALFELSGYLASFLDRAAAGPKARVCGRDGCDRPLPAPRRTGGRPRQFCSERCRRAAYRAHPGRTTR